MSDWTTTSHLVGANVQYLINIVTKTPAQKRILCAAVTAAAMKFAFWLLTQVEWSNIIASPSLRQARITDLGSHFDGAQSIPRGGFAPYDAVRAERQMSEIDARR